MIVYFQMILLIAFFLLLQRAFVICCCCYLFSRFYFIRIGFFWVGGVWQRIDCRCETKLVQLSDIILNKSEFINHQFCLCQLITIDNMLCYLMALRHTKGNKEIGNESRFLFLLMKNKIQKRWSKVAFPLHVIGGWCVWGRNQIDACWFEYRNSCLLILQMSMRRLRMQVLSWRELEWGGGCCWVITAPAFLLYPTFPPPPPHPSPLTHTHTRSLTSRPSGWEVEILFV